MGLLGGINGAFFIGACVITVGLLLEIIGVSTEEWSVASILHATLGLRKVCLDGECTSYRSRRAVLEVTEAFAILAILGTIATLAIAVAYVTSFIMGTEKKFSLLVLVGVVAFFSLVCAVISVSVYGSTFHPKNMDLGYSFILTIVGGCLTALGGVLSSLSA
ncbi:uncharacterized protein LOC131929704 [Physella acuta]|uniref:uncharacterized protein LOC131929704 n=1 Tax=Physella acuta TaxID=109671 RepID=UPI0027DB2F7A|nr:uncharacterized protein LOC131929704 [Physella acuta]